MVLGTRNGLAIRFNEKDVRDMGKTATGVKGIRLCKGDVVAGLIVINRASTILLVTDKGYGKRSDLDDYRITHRGGNGVKTIKTSDKNGKMIGIR